MKAYVMKFKKDEKLLEKMLELRRQGWTYVSLGFIFGVDHSSIYKWCKVKRIPRPSVTIAIDVPTIISGFGYQSRHEKTYQEYLQEDRLRHSKIHA